MRAMSMNWSLSRLSTSVCLALMSQVYICKISV